MSLAKEEYGDADPLQGGRLRSHVMEVKGGERLKPRSIEISQQVTEKCTWTAVAAPAIENKDPDIFFGFVHKFGKSCILQDHLL